MQPAVRVVREDHPAVQLDVRPAVGPGRRAERLDHEPGTERGVRTGVGEHVDLERGEVAVARGAASTPDPVRVPLRGRHEGLGPAVDDLDRPARPIRGQRRQALARDLRLPAERAPADRGSDADALDRQAQRPRDLGPLVVGVLRRRPDDERVALPEGQRRLRLEVGVLVPRGRVGVLDHDVGAGEPFRDVARPQPVLGQQVAAGMDPRRAVRERVVGRRTRPGAGGTPPRSAGAPRPPPPARSPRRGRRDRRPGEPWSPPGPAGPSPCARSCSPRGRPARSGPPRRPAARRARSVSMRTISA